VTFSGFLSKVGRGAGSIRGGGNKVPEVYVPSRGTTDLPRDVDILYVIKTSWLIETLLCGCNTGNPAKIGVWGVTV
jgi:hypothetical protein